MVYRREYPKKTKPKNPNDGTGKSSGIAGGKVDRPQPAAGGKKDLPARSVAKKETATVAAKPKAKPAAAPPKPTMKPSKGPASGKMAYEAPKSNFKGNWTGAAPTEMQKRGGAKISRGGGLLGAIKRKLGK
jgi:hypothetical protein